MNEMKRVKVKVQKRTVLKFKDYPLGSATCSMCIILKRAEHFDAILNTTLLKYKLTRFQEYFSGKFSLC